MSARSPRPLPAVQLARDVLHYEDCRIRQDRGVNHCPRCSSHFQRRIDFGGALVAKSLARALLRAVRK